MRRRYSVALTRGIGPTSATGAARSDTRPGAPSVNSQTLPAALTFSEHGVAAAAASASDGKFSIR